MGCASGRRPSPPTGVIASFFAPFFSIDFWKAFFRCLLIFSPPWGPQKPSKITPRESCCDHFGCARRTAGRLDEFPIIRGLQAVGGGRQSAVGGRQTAEWHDGREPNRNARTEPNRTENIRTGNPHEPNRTEPACPGSPGVEFYQTRDYHPITILGLG